MLRNIVSNELFTVLLVISLIIVAIAKLVSPKRFGDFILVIGTISILKFILENKNSLTILTPCYLVI